MYLLKFDMTEFWGEHEPLFMRLRQLTFRSIGPINLTLGSLYPHKNRIIPTVTDNLFKQGKIEQNLVSVSFEPTSDSPITNGELIFGGVDSAKYIGDINYL